MRYAVLAGRQLFSIVFIIASAAHFSPAAIESAARHGVPLPEVLVPLSGMIALAGGLNVLLGFQTRIGAGLLVIFLVPVTVVMHNFWASTDPLMHQIEQAMFLKNLTMLGGALVISYFGAGPRRRDVDCDIGLMSRARRPLRVHLIHTRRISSGTFDRTQANFSQSGTMASGEADIAVRRLTHGVAQCSAKGSDLYGLRAGAKSRALSASSGLISTRRDGRAVDGGGLENESDRL